jgi:hypothetical protein
LALALFILAGCGADPRTAPERPRAPVYAAADIYRFDFQGVRLGMTREEACSLIVANGYRNRDGAGCGPTVPHREGETEPVDVFLGRAMRDCARESCEAGTPAANVQFLSLTYQRVDGRDVVRKINADTAEPGPVGPKEEAAIRAWGPPTFHEPARSQGAFSVLIYGATPAEADWMNRETYNRCGFSPDCEARRGTDCGAVLSDFANVTAEVTVYDWGRWVRIEDRRPELGALRASGRLRGRRLAPSPLGCMQVGGVH